MGLIKEFKEFALRGNLIDLAVGVVIGAAFTKLTNSLVNDIIMPPIGKLVGNVDFSQLKIRLQEGHPEIKAPDGKVVLEAVPEVAVRYGAFINTLIDLLIVAFAMFVVIKMINRLKKKEAAAPTVEPVPTKEETLLTEIRDLLKENRN